MQVKTDIDLIDNIRLILKQNGIKQKKIAADSGLTERQFSDLLNGRRKFAPSDIYLISCALGCTPNDLYGITSKIS
ncbi:MAG: helix-turn-helix transcriptional regulator [Ruminococcus sp.]|nr:helix-turn-helix transcriptional regulator [Ruminococcus sp.]